MEIHHLLFGFVSKQVCTGAQFTTYDADTPRYLWQRGVLLPTPPKWPALKY